MAVPSRTEKDEMVCVCGAKSGVLSENQYIKSGWGSFRNFAASYGCKMTPDGIDEARCILKAMIEHHRAAFVQQHKQCKSKHLKQAKMKVHIVPLLDDGLAEKPFIAEIDPKQKVSDVVMLIYRRFGYPVRQIQVSKYFGKEQVILDNEKHLCDYDICNGDELRWLSVPSFFV